MMTIPQGIRSHDVAGWASAVARRLFPDNAFGRHYQNIVRGMSSVLCPLSFVAGSCGRLGSGHGDGSSGGESAELSAGL